MEPQVLNGQTVLYTVLVGPESGLFGSPLQ